MTKIYTAYFDRKPLSVDGVLTLQSYDGEKIVKVFDKMHVRSGQRGFEKTSWTVGKSPIPYSREVKGGQYYLWTKPVPLQMSPGGRFYHISTDIRNQHIIVSANGLNRRTEAGCHKENDKYGTQCCIAWVNHNVFDEFGDYIEKLGVPWIKLVVE